MTKQEIKNFFEELKSDNKKFQRVLDILTIEGFSELDELEKIYLEYEKNNGDGSMSEKQIKKTYFTPIEKALRKNSEMSKANEELSILLGKYSEKIEALENYCEVVSNFIEDSNLKKEFAKYARNFIREKKNYEEEYIEA